MNLRGGIFRDVGITFRTGTDKIVDQNFAILMDSAVWDRVIITEAIPAAKAPASSYFIEGPTAASLKDCRLISTSQKLRWTSWSPGAGGFVGEFDNHEESVRNLGLFRHLGGWAEYYGKTRVFAGDAAPPSGTFVSGDIVLNEAPAAGGKIGWVCVGGGSPGSWKPFGSIDA